MESKTRKELKSQYNEREIIGGAYIIKNAQTGRILLETSTDLRASKNRFDFSQKTSSCPVKKLEKDWVASGAGAFVFEVLEEHVKKSSRTSREFQEDMAALKELWREKLTGDNAVLY